LLSFVFYFSGLNFILKQNFHLCGMHVSPPPVVLFVMNWLSYLAFLVFVLQLDRMAVHAATGDDNTTLEMFLAYWLLDICFSEAVEFFHIMKNHRLSAPKAILKYIEDPWNVYDAIALCTAVAAAFVRGLVRSGVGDASAAASDELCAWALALLWGRLVNVLAAFSFVGPLLIMVFVMVFKDLTKFAVLVVLMELPFVAALYFLESGDAGNEAFATFPVSALSFFKIVIGQGPDISSLTASAAVLLSLGSVLLSVLLVNLLIAMFSKTFDTIIENSTQEYLLQKAQLTFAWSRAPRMPPPFVCALNLRDWAMRAVSRHLCGNACFAECCTSDNSSEEDYRPVFMDNRQDFYKMTRLDKGDSRIEEDAAQDEEYSDAAYEAWCRQVLEDFEENAEFNSESQMEKFKSRVLRGMSATVESSGKLDQLKLQVAEESSTAQQQTKALSDALQMQHAQLKQLEASFMSTTVESSSKLEQLKLQIAALSYTVQTQHASMQLIINRLNVNS
jgi:hypothetical protein